MAACDTDLYGRIGKVEDEQQYAFISAIAHSLGLSRSELVERIGRGVIPIHLDPLKPSKGTL